MTMSGIVSSEDNTLQSSKGQRKSWPKPEFVLSRGNGKIRKTLKKEDQCKTIKDQQRIARKRFTSRTYWRKKRAEEHEIVSQLTIEQSDLRKLNDLLASKNQALRECIAQIRNLKAHHQKFHLLNQVSSPPQQSRHVQSLVTNQPNISLAPLHLQQILYQRLLNYSVPQQILSTQRGSIAPMATAINQLVVPTHQNDGLQQTLISLSAITQSRSLDLHPNSNNTLTSVMNLGTQPIGGATLNSPFPLPADSLGLAFNIPSIQVGQIQQQLPLIPCDENVVNHLSSTHNTANKSGNTLKYRLGASLI